LKIIQRKYLGEDDKQKMIRLAQECRGENIHVFDLPYRLSSWALDEPDNIGLWVDEFGGLVAWAVMQTPFWTVDYIIRHDVEDELHTHVLGWADQRAHDMLGTLYGLPAWYVNVFSDLTNRKQVLERAGFSDQASTGEDSWSKVWMERSGNTEIPGFPAPAGFTTRSLAGESEVEAYVELHRAVFETKKYDG
jgi:hypothetical protein